MCNEGVRSLCTGPHSDTSEPDNVLSLAIFPLIISPFRSWNVSARSRAACSRWRSPGHTQGWRRSVCPSSAPAHTATGAPSTTWTGAWCRARCTATRRSGHTRDTASSSSHQDLSSFQLVLWSLEPRLRMTEPFKTVFIAHYNVTIKLPIIKKAQNHNDYYKFQVWDGETKIPLIKSVRTSRRKRDVFYKANEIRSWTIWKQFTCFSELWYVG